MADQTSCLPPKGPSDSFLQLRDRSPDDIAHAKLVQSISQTSMSPADINDIDRRLGLLKERPTGENKLDRLHCVCILPVDEGSQECFQVTTAQRGRVEQLIASPRTRATVFFVNFEEDFYNIYREHGVEKAFRVSLFFQMHNNTLDWLLNLVKPHSSYAISLDSPQGYFGNFFTRGEDGRPDHLHIAVKVPHNGGIGAAAYIRIDLKTDQVVAIFSSHTRQQAGPDNFTRYEGDSGRSRFQNRFRDAESMGSGFVVALNILEEYLSAMQSIRQYAWQNLLAMERVTGRGALYEWFSHNQHPRLHDFSADDVRFVHQRVTETNSNTSAIVFQRRLTAMLITAHHRYCARRSQVASSDEAVNEAMNDTLLAHQARVECLLENLIYNRDRTRMQLDVVNTSINQATSDRAGRSAESMKILALAGMIFLPCGLIAQILDLGFFEIEQPAMQLNRGMSSLVLIFVLTILATLVCCVAYAVGLRLWRRLTRRKVASLAGDGAGAV